MVTVRKSKLLSTSSVVAENTYYYEFDVDTIAELPDPYYNGTIVAHGSKATIIANGRQYRINGEGEWCIQRYDASDPILIEKTITENGTYTAVDDDADGYSSVDVDVEINVGTKNITSNGTYKAVDDEVDGYSEVTVNVAGVEFDTLPANFSLLGNIKNLNVSIPNGCVSIKQGAFSQCPGLKSIIIPDTVKTIYDNAFIECTGLTSINLNKAEDISTNAFRGCHNLSEVIMTNAQYLQSNCFRECTALTSIEIPNTIISIQSNTFTGCTNLQTITINKAEGSVSGAPWGATNATVVWTG